MTLLNFVAFMATGLAALITAGCILAVIIHKKYIYQLEERIEGYQLLISELRPATNLFTFNWTKKHLTEAKFNEIIEYLVSRENKHLNWDAGWIKEDDCNDARNFIRIKSTDQTEAVLFKLRFGNDL